MSTKPQPTPGRSGTKHKSIQSNIKKFAQSLDYGAIIGKSIVEGRGAVDVALVKGDVSIACEISITTPTDHECNNLAKCVDAGFTYVVMTCDSEKQLTKVKAKVSEILDPATFERVHFMRLDELFHFIGDLERTVHLDEEIK